MLYVMSIILPFKTVILPIIKLLTCIASVHIDRIKAILKSNDKGTSKDVPV